MQTSRILAAPPARLGLPAAAMLWTLLLLMIVPEGFDYRILLSGYHPEVGSTLSRFLWIALLIAASALIAFRAAITWSLLRQLNPFLLLFAFLALCSVAWSADPALTLRRDVRLLTMLLVCVAFCVTGWHPRRLQNVVRPLLTLLLVGSLAFGLLMPSLAVHQENAPELIGAWRGLTNHKNSFGALAGVTLLFWVQAWAAREIRALPALLATLLAVMGLWLSRSATSWIATLFALGFLGALTQWPRSLQPYFKYAVALLVAALLLYVLVVLRLVPGQGLLLSPIASLAGFDTSFTGRSEIWTIVGEQVARHPWLGTGYGAYWSGPTLASPSYEFISRMGGFYPGSAHNGYLEIANDLGWAGLICLLGYIVVQLRQSLRALAVDKPQGALCLMLFMHQAVANLSESHWLSVLSVQFVLTTLVTVALARLWLDHLTRYRYAQMHGAAAVRAPAHTWPVGT